MYTYKKTFLFLLIYTPLLLLAGCQSAPNGAVPSSANGATPSSSATPTYCPQLPAAAAGPAPTAPLSVYVKTAGDALMALNASDGSARWQMDSSRAGGSVTSQTVEQNAVYIVTGRGAISALNATDDAVRWCTLADGQLLMPGVTAYPSLVTDQDSVYATDGATGIVLALRASDGAVRWKVQVQGGDSLLAAAAGQVYVSLGQSISALDASTGKENWHFQPAFSALNSNIPAALADGMLYFITYDFQNDASTLYAVGVSDGKERWHVKNQHGFGAPVVANGVFNS